MHPLFDFLFVGLGVVIVGYVAWMFIREYAGGRSRDRLADNRSATPAVTVEPAADGKGPAAAVAPDRPVTSVFAHNPPRKRIWERL